MIPTRIFLDLDDVMNAFTMHALQVVGCPVGAFDHHKYKPEWGFDIVKAANRLHETHHFTKGTFWDSIDRKVWSSAPVSRELNDLLHRCLDLVGYKNIHILTTPTEDPECLAGKLEWIHQHLPEWIHRQYIMTPQKHLLADCHSLLIDDSEENVKRFRQYGGQAILVPRPWNGLHHVKTWPHILSSLNIIFHKERIKKGCI